jgi:hypothetical protein
MQKDLLCSEAAGATLLDNIYYQIKRHSKFEHEEQYDLNTLWDLGSYFLSYEGLRLFDHYPMLAFMSPEPDSGKTNALEVTSRLACNATPPSSLTTAGILRKIDLSPEMITVCLDDLDTKFIKGEDNAALVMLLNLGYKRDSLVTRCSTYNEGLIETKAFCPKAFSGLKIAKIPAATITRTFIINMHPKTDKDVILDDMDVEGLEKLRKKIVSEVPIIAEKLKDVEIPLDDIAFLINRKRQILKPLLGLAKVFSEDWYQRALKVAKFFADQQTEKTITHKILFGCYRIFRNGYQPDSYHPHRIHSHTLLDRLYQFGVENMDVSQLARHLETYGIRPRQMKIDGLNRNGYEWQAFFKTFSDYITDKEVEEVEAELRAPYLEKKIS